MRNRIAFAAILLAAGSAARGSVYSSMVNFGDSLSDVGNDYVNSQTFAGLGLIPNPIPNGPGYFNGRFSNGPIWMDDLAAHYGLPAPTPSSSGGNDYAYGNATTGTGTNNFFIQNIRTQVNSYTASHTATATQLFTILGGGNDLFSNLDSGTTVITPAAAADNIAGSIGALYTDGARNVVVVNLPDLGKTPKYRTTSLNTSASSMTVAFNTELATDLNSLQSTDPGLTLYRVDLFTKFNNAITNPGSFGLTNVTDQAYTGDTSFAGNGTAVANANSYLFYDQVHPTSTGQSLIANATFAAVPEPASTALMLIAVPLLTRRFRHSR